MQTPKYPEGNLRMLWSRNLSDALSSTGGPGVDISWNASEVRVVLLSQHEDIGPAGTTVFSVAPTAIVSSMLASGGGELIITLQDGTKYDFLAPMPHVDRQSQGSVLTVLDAAVDMFTNKALPKDFQEFMKSQGVTTYHSSIVKIIAVTVVSFVAVIIALAFVVVRVTE